MKIASKKPQRGILERTQSAVNMDLASSSSEANSLCSSETGLALTPLASEVEDIELETNDKSDKKSNVNASSGHYLSLPGSILFKSKSVQDVSAGILESE